jgi:hypothetical protein
VPICKLPLAHICETMSFVVSMEVQTIHGSPSGGSAWHFKIATMSVTVTSMSSSSIEEKRVPGRLQPYFKFS